MQVDYSPFVLEIENETGTDLLATCRELGIALVAAMPLGRGMITSTFTSNDDQQNGGDVRRKMMPRFMDGNREKNVEIVKQFQDFADRKGCSTSQLALAWLLKQGDDVIPIPGMKRVKYLEENWEARNIALTDDEEAEIRKFLESAAISGKTLPPMFESYNYVDTVEES